MRSLHSYLHAILPLLAVVAATAFTTPSLAADINLIGIFGAKATFMVDGGKPRTLAVGESSPEKIRMLSIGTDSAVVVVSSGDGEKGGIGLERCGVGGTSPNLDLRIKFWKRRKVVGQKVRTRQR